MSTKNTYMIEYRPGRFRRWRQRGPLNRLKALYWLARFRGEKTKIGNIRFHNRIVSPGHCELLLNAAQAWQKIDQAETQLANRTNRADQDSAPLP